MVLFHQAAGVQRKIMKLIGILPFGDRRALQFCLCIFDSVIIICISVYLFWQSSQSPNFWEGVTSITILGSMVLTLARFTVLRCRIGRIEKLFSDLDEISFGRHLSKGLKIYNQTIHTTKFLSKLAVISYCVIMGTIAMQPLLFWQLMLPADAWVPVKISRSFKNWLCHYVFQVTAIISWVLTSVLVDTLPAVILLLINGQLKSLGHQAKNLPISPSGTWSSSLKFCFKEYIKILKVCREFEDIFSKVYLFQMTILCCNLCASAIALNLMTGTAQVIGVLANIIILFQVFCPCCLGNLLVVSSERLKFELYSSCWFDLFPAESRKGIFIFMQALQNPISISFGQIFTLNLETFAEVVKIVYRLYALAGCMSEELVT